VRLGGNDDIVVSVLTDSNQTNFTDDELLYESSIVSKTDRKRRIYLLPVSRLLCFVKEAKHEGIEIEHIFDY